MPDSHQLQLLSSAEVCSVLDIDRSTLLRWVASGKVKAAVKMPGKSGAYLFDPGEIARMVIDKARAG